MEKTAELLKAIFGRNVVLFLTTFTTELLQTTTASAAYPIPRSPSKVRAKGLLSCSLLTMPKPSTFSKIPDLGKDKLMAFRQDRQTLVAGCAVHLHGRQLQVFDMNNSKLACTYSMSNWQVRTLNSGGWFLGPTQNRTSADESRVEAIQVSRAIQMLFSNTFAPMMHVAHYLQHLAHFICFF
eukprot:6474655-Amphidinium_carterae.4